ncbi:hypothetical protein GIB67_001237, partial [Kingdonia uniflora]
NHSLSLNLSHSKFKFHSLSSGFPPLNHSVSLNLKFKFLLNSHTLYLPPVKASRRHPNIYQQTQHPNIYQQGMESME